MRAALLVVTLGIAGCAGMIQSANEDLQDDLTKRATFDLDCEADALSFEILEEYSNGLVKSFGVRGCGKRATYVRSQSGVWIMNSGPGVNDGGSAETPAPTG